MWAPQFKTAATPLLKKLGNRAAAVRSKRRVREGCAAHPFRWASSGLVKTPTFWGVRVAEQKIAAERPPANISTVYEVNYMVMTTIQLENHLRGHCARRSGSIPSPLSAVQTPVNTVNTLAHGESFGRLTASAMLKQNQKWRQTCRLALLRASRRARANSKRLPHSHAAVVNPEEKWRGYTPLPRERSPAALGTMPEAPSSVRLSACSRESAWPAHREM